MSGINGGFQPVNPSPMALLKVIVQRVNKRGNLDLTARKPISSATGPASASAGLVPDIVAASARAPFPQDGRVLQDGRAVSERWEPGKGARVLF